MDQEPESKQITTDDARQGVTGHNVRYVLLFGIVGLLAAYLIIVVLGLVRPG